MEAAKPITSLPNKIINFQEFYNYKQNYYIRISYTDNEELTIVCYNLEKLDNIRYEIKRNIQEIYQINNIFRQYINIKDIYDLIIDQINEEKCNIKENYESNLMFSFMISDIKGIKQNIELILRNIKNNNNYYQEYTNILSNEIKNLRNFANKEISKLKEEIKIIKDTISYYKETKNADYEKKPNEINNKRVCLNCGTKNDIKKCICGKYYCPTCISNEINIECKKQCYLFNNNLNTITEYYQISKFPLPKNFEAKIYYNKIDNNEPIRVGITFDKNIIYEKTYSLDSPKYNIYYRGNRFYSYEKGWSDLFHSDKNIKKEDYLTLKVKDGKLSYCLNGISLEDSYLINSNDINNKEMYLLIHRKNKVNECQIIYLYELND